MPLTRRHGPLLIPACLGNDWTSPTTAPRHPGCRCRPPPHRGPARDPQGLRHGGHDRHTEEPTAGRVVGLARVFHRVGGRRCQLHPFPGAFGNRSVTSRRSRHRSPAPRTSRRTRGATPLLAIQNVGQGTDGPSPHVQPDESALARPQHPRWRAAARIGPTKGGNIVRDFQLWPVVVFGGWLSDKLAEHHRDEDED